MDANEFIDVSGNGNAMIVPQEGLSDAEKLEFVYQFAVKMTAVLEALGNNPMASMMLGGSFGNVE